MSRGAASSSIESGARCASSASISSARRTTRRPAPSRWTSSSAATSSSTSATRRWDGSPRGSIDCLAEGGVLLTAGADPHPRRACPLRSRGDARGPRLPAPSPRTAGSVPAGLARAAQSRPRSPPRRGRGEPRGASAADRPPAPAPPELERRGVRARDGDTRTRRGSRKRNGWRRWRFAATPWTPPCTTCGPRSSCPWTATRRRSTRRSAPSTSIAPSPSRTSSSARSCASAALRAGALRAFRNVRDLCAARPSDEEVPAGAGERAGALHSAASAEMERLEVTVG